MSAGYLKLASIVVVVSLLGCPGPTATAPFTIPYGEPPDYDGPVSVYEGELVNFTGKYFPSPPVAGLGCVRQPHPLAVYTWSCNPPNAGVFYDSPLRTVSFLANDVPWDTRTLISVTASDPAYGTDNHDWNIMILDSPDPIGWGKVWDANGTGWGSRGPAVALPTERRQIVAGITKDPSGNLYIVGSYEGTTDFDPDPTTSCVLPDLSGMFLSKFDSSGDFQWVSGWKKPLVFGDPEPEDEDFAPACDLRGNIYVTSNLNGRDPSGDFPPKLVLRKTDPSGNLVWEREYDAQPTCLAVSASGDIVMSGRYTGKLGLKTAPPDSDAPTLHTFIARLDSDGNEIWTRVWTSNLSAERIAFDPAGDILLLGSDYSPQPTRPPNRCSFINRLTADGQHVWSAAVPPYAEDFVLDSKGSIVLCGSFGEPFDFDPGPAVKSVSPACEADFFLLKLDRDGAFQWVGTWKGKTHFRESAKLAIDGADNIFVSCSFEGTVDFDPGPSVDEHDSTKGDMFLSKFSPAGNLQWARNWKNIYWNVEYGQYDLVVLPDGRIYLTGTFARDFDFDPGPSADTWVNLQPGHGYSGEGASAFLLTLPADGNYR